MVKTKTILQILDCLYVFDVPQKEESVYIHVLYVFHIKRKHQSILVNGKC